MRIERQRSQDECERRTSAQPMPTEPVLSPWLQEAERPGICPPDICRRETCPRDTCQPALTEQRVEHEEYPQQPLFRVTQTRPSQQPRLSASESPIIAGKSALSGLLLTNN